MVETEAPKAASGAVRAKPGPRTGQICDRIPLLTRLKARSLYITQQLGITAIADQTGLTVSQVRGLVAREGWVNVKKRARNVAEAKSLARTQANIEEVVEAVAIDTEELALGTLGAAKDVLRDKSGDFWAKDLQSLSQAAKNFVGLARQARGLANDADTSNGKANTSVIFVSLERVTKSEPKRVVEETSTRRTEHVLPLDATSEVSPFANFKPKGNVTVEAQVVADATPVSTAPETERPS